jgi:hypothetical protein
LAKCEEKGSSLGWMEGEEKYMMVALSLVLIGHVWGWHKVYQAL